ncbi:arginine N-methyltransferase [Wallemia mellicola CBS 633.66]|uniref:Arginine N-methyltransferase 2 n=1 Tax=Wallemia mellicola (strain ATCC MYA-4683 / CBS 633.66) TaxID=671144 RepID=I4Y8X3_WALMC|nr:arginine N-methyltransferase [Wallemia mellicola CBS 633.66]EIM20415.1 arginine N-methyltransferase [Wallemia mellicola CBS 633.66]|eukprot:XP_006959441.1 arginine N-methyltransferase [Wallemia mellicola CBS 633.66]
MALLHCCATDDIENVKQLIDKGAPIYYQDASSGYTCLHFAADIQSTKLVKYLISQGATWNALDHTGYTPAEIALSYGNEKIYEEIVGEGVRAEFLLNLLGQKAENDEADPASSLNAFLSSKLTYEYDDNGQERVVDSAGDPVMMAWETPIMKSSVAALCDNHEDASDEGLAILNVGFGLGIIDTEFQKQQPSNHTIIEAHPDVLKHMKETGWYDKPGVRICEGKWQDFIYEIGQFDVIYFDTFSEHYRDLHAFFEHIPELVNSPNSRFSFFHGLGATNPVFYDVYTRISDLHLDQIGMSAEWQDVPVKELSAVWKGVRRSYWNLPCYKLPIAKMNIF